MQTITELETDRLRLRQWQDRDHDPFALLNADARVMEFYPATLDRAASQAMVDRCQRLIAERGWGLWAVELKATQQFIGYVGLHIPGYELPFSPCVEVGWRLAYDHWGQGYATEAAKASLAFGFEQLKLATIVSFTAVQNTRSRAVMERLGMQQTGTFEHPSLPVNHPLRLHYLYQLRL
jgi:RimJ/RimL family protein N-acetyltransferase